MSASSQSRGTRSMQPMPPPSPRARPTMANQVRGSIMIRVTTPPMCSTPTATASNLFSRAGSTFSVWSSVPRQCLYLLMQSVQRPVRNAELLQMAHCIGEVVAPGAAPALRHRDNTRRVIERQTSGVIRPVAAHDKGIGADPALGRRYADRPHAVDLARHFARPDLVDRRAQPLRREPIGDTLA